MSLSISNPSEMVLVTNIKFLDKLKLDDAIQLVNYMNDAHCMHNPRWIP